MSREFGTQNCANKISYRGKEEGRRREKKKEEEEKEEKKEENKRKEAKQEGKGKRIASIPGSISV
jgi:hypothetical protein